MIFSISPMFEQSINQICFSLAWTLVHSLWQAATVVVLLYGVIAMGRNVSSGARYLMGLCAFSVVVGLSVYSFTYHYSAYHDTALLIQSGKIPGAKVGISIAGRYISSFSKEVSLLWVLGFTLALVRYLGAVLYCKRLVDGADTILPAFVSALVARVREQLQVRKEVKTLLSPSVETPCVIGHFNPVLLLPLAFVTNIERAELEVILLHEFAHIRRNDYLVGLIQHLLKTLYFFNPFVHMISRIIDAERENICDDMAVNCCGDAYLYSRTLEKMSQLSMKDGLPMAIRGKSHSMLARIKRQFEKRAVQQKPYASVMAMVAMSLSLLLVTTNAIGNALHNRQFQGFASLSQQQVAELILNARNAVPKAGVDGRSLRNHFLDGNPMYQNLAVPEKEKLISYLKQELWFYHGFPEWDLMLEDTTPERVSDELRRLQFSRSMESQFWHLLLGDADSTEQLSNEAGEILVQASLFEKHETVELELSLRALSALQTIPPLMSESKQLYTGYNKEMGLFLAVKPSSSQFDLSESFSIANLTSPDLVYFQQDKKTSDKVNKIRGALVVFFSYDNSWIVNLSPLMVQNILTDNFVNTGTGYAGVEVVDGEKVKIYFERQRSAETQNRFKQIYFQYGTHKNNVAHEVVDKQFDEKLALLSEDQKAYLYTDAEIKDFILALEMTQGYSLSSKTQSTFSHHLSVSLAEQILKGDYGDKQWKDNRPIYMPSSNNAFIAFRHYLPSSNPREYFHLDYRHQPFSSVISTVLARCDNMSWLTPLAGDSVEVSVKYLNLNCERARVVMCRMVGDMYKGEAFGDCDDEPVLEKIQ